jgi:hypothetical protein
MTSPKADRHDLYNGLIEVLGPKRAETLMAAIPPFDISELLTRTELRAQLAELRAEFKSDLHQILLALIGGLIVILGAMIGLAFLP